MTDGTQAGVGTTVLFENDRVQIWEMDLAPGEATGMHHHEHDHGLVVLAGDEIAEVPPPEAGAETLVSEMTALPLVAQVPRA